MTYKRVYVPVLLAFVVASCGLLISERHVHAQGPGILTTYADVTANGAAQALAGSGACGSLQLVALNTNTGVIRFGDANVSATQGIPLYPGSPDREALPYTINLSAMYFYGASGDKLSFTCMR